jgi:hypothetical protein
MARFLIILSGLLLTAGTANAVDTSVSWPQIIQACAAEVQKGQRVASGNGMWPSIATCAAQFAPGITQQQTTACINKVYAADWNMPMGHDRVMDVLRCLAVTQREVRR